MANEFCKYLSNGYSFSIEKGSMRVRPCCWFGSSIPMDDNLLINRQRQFESINGWTHDCTSCRLLEECGQPSLRQAYPDSAAIQQNFQDPVSIDINLDTECNAACVICNVVSSSLWRKEVAKQTNTSIKIHSENSVQHYIDKIVNSVPLDKISYVKFFGGEPLFTDTHLQFIDQIPYPEQVTLHYTTNGSIYPSDKVLTQWKKFKTVIFSVSLDGIEQQFDYVRWPLPWEKVSKNLLRLRNNTDIWNLLFRIEFTVNWMNAYYFDKLETWVQQNFSHNQFGDKTEINIHKCWGGQWGLDLMPNNIRELVMSKYSQDHKIHAIVKQLTAPGSLGRWEEFVKTWDQRRNNSWQQAFPELVNFL